MINIKSKKIQDHFISNRLLYVIVVTLIFLGTLIGAIFGINAHSASTSEGYLDTIFSVCKLRGISHFEVFMHSITSNLRNIFIIWISGWFIWLIPFNFITLLGKGFGIGYTISFLVTSSGVKGFLFAFINLFFQNIIILPLITIFSVIEFKYALKLSSIKNSSSHFRQRRRLILNNTLILLIIVLISILSSGIEAYIVPFLIKFII